MKQRARPAEATIQAIGDSLHVKNWQAGSAYAASVRWYDS
jgi:hypothetical protein